MRIFAWTLRALAPLAISAVALGGLGGCTTEAACFANCNGIDGNDLGGTDNTGTGGLAGTLSIDMGGRAGSGIEIGGSVASGGRVFEDAGTPCDDVDTQTDLNNCGICGNGCVFTGADAMCVKGKCVLGDCIDGRYDLDGDPDNGCEYACTPTADPAEICDGIDNDCDGVIDNDFDLSTDPDNCGACNQKCSLLHASSTCQPGVGAPTCVVTGCEAGHYDVNHLDNDGCEYECTKTGKNGVACNGTDPTCGSVEYCDAADNDCNGVINDGNAASGGPEGGKACDDYCPGKKCVGACTSGVTTCVGKDLVCIPGKGPTLETCDLEDNDCDGKIDNGFDLGSDPNNCGACGTSCVGTVPNAVGKCFDADPSANPPPACIVAACKPGFKDLDPNKPGCEYTCPKFPTSAETCNGIDDDCDGVVDNAAAIVGQKPAVDLFCNNGRPLGATPCVGTTVTCGGVNGWACTYPAGKGIEVDPTTKKVRVVEALCDDGDGNCDGQKDEAFLNKDASCSIGTGICSRSGKYACTADHQGTECPATAVATDAVDELCNGLDDDCDGQIDERTPKAGSKCYTAGVAHDCIGYVEPMVKVANNLWVYSYEASRPDATIGDAGIEDVRSCSKAGVLPWTSISQTDAEKTCEAIPTSVPNTQMRLCTEAEWQTSCLAGGSANTTTWSYSTTPSVYDDLTCNDAATGLNLPWETSHNNGQIPRCRTSTMLWDMSGNVAEWTSSCVTVLNKQYCRVRGGSFLSQGPATSCNFSFVLDVPEFANFDLGFRCCSSVAP